MEGKGVLFKIFADIDVFDIEINEKDPEKFVQIACAGTHFGGINLEDIKSAWMFYIEQELERSVARYPSCTMTSMARPSSAQPHCWTRWNCRKKNQRYRSWWMAPAPAAVSCIQFRCQQENIKCGTTARGLIRAGRMSTWMKSRKIYLHLKKPIHWKRGLKDTGCIYRFEQGNVVTPDMVKSMAKNPIILRWPILIPRSAMKMRLQHAGCDHGHRPQRLSQPGEQMCLGFPYIFRGALDVRATTINEAMKLAAP